MKRIAFLLSVLVTMAAAQPGPNNNSSNNNNQYPYARFSPSMAIIIVVLIAALFFMGFFSIYIRHCSDSSSRGPVGSIRRALSRRAAAAAARGLDPSALESLPTFTYSEVRDHKIGKGALECAICLNEFEPDEALRLIPTCDHVFHQDCIDAWLASHVTCPVCRADLTPDPPSAAAADDDDGDDNQLPSSTTPAPPPAENPQITVQVDDEARRPGRSASLARAKMVFGLGRFRSHSTGHSVPAGVVQPGENLERFTLRLPEQVRREVMDRSLLNRTGSCVAPAGLPRGGSSRSNRGRSYRRIEREGVRSDRWLFFSRGLSMKSPKVVAEAGEGSGGGGSRAPMKMPSFKCLEPKAADEAGLFSPDRDARPPV
ncbi:RING/U-box superfamily protein [Striga asiatica]|uniref:RING-type E3 ubiquitin transferase n=1 Tax=Striga asiatica TaxID=4170 RepID=A0A5A7NYA2_STRAF|nr:RING/U-box superfamily protein [Striga asiatica]